MTTDKLYKHCILFAFGGMLYAGIELFCRGYSHWSMMILGGVCFLLIGTINEIIPWEMSLWKQMLICSIVITALEFVTGCFVNIVMGWSVWDYSDEWGNILGQICPKFSLYWFFLSLIAILLDDWIRYAVFDEERPHYKIF
ncbi:MAG: hypothetical protein IJF18_02070 [Oscillospiraceae bacterium]|nr:hypothetical protein [Oscillospiraceae bacterium]